MSKPKHDLKFGQVPIINAWAKDRESWTHAELDQLHKLLGRTPAKAVILAHIKRIKRDNNGRFRTKLRAETPTADRTRAAGFLDAETLTTKDVVFTNFGEDADAHGGYGGEQSFQFVRRDRKSGISQNIARDADAIDNATQHGDFLSGRQHDGND